MDPEEALKQLRAYLKANPEAPSGLVEWLDKGGALPAVWAPPKTPQFELAFRGESEQEIQQKIETWLAPRLHGRVLHAPNIDQAQVGTDLINRAHHLDVVQIANTVLGAMLTGEIDDEGDLMDYLCSEAERAVTYTITQFQVLLASRNADAAVDNGFDIVVNGQEINWALLAAEALRADVQEQLGRLETGDSEDTDDPLEKYVSFEFADEAEEGGFTTGRITYDGLELEAKAESVEDVLEALREQYQVKRK